MKRLLPLAAALFILSGCSSLDVESTPTSETPPSASTSVTETAEETPRPSLPAAEDSAEDVDVDQPQEEVIGFTEAPGVAQPTPMEKTIESCGDVSLHETGTTFFSDGTSGWTQQCADEMMAATPPVQEAAAIHEQPAVQQNYVHPSAYCTGGSGVSKKGIPMTCAPGSDGRMRWQSA